MLPVVSTENHFCHQKKKLSRAKKTRKNEKLSKKKLFSEDEELQHHAGRDALFILAKETVQRKVKEK